MKRYGVFLLLFIVWAVIAAGCGSDSASDEGYAGGMGSTSNQSAEPVEHKAFSEEAAVADDAGAAADGAEAPIPDSQERMIVYHANLRIVVEDFQNMQQKLQQLVSETGGYIVRENVHRGEENRVSGEMVARVPQDRFHAFLDQVEAWSVKVRQRAVSGQDVTEQYVDLESRLRSKEAVEQRLFEFMERAEKTEDLLKISENLSSVQEEIERIKGKMKYLENQSALSTVEIHYEESKVFVPEVGEKLELQTWQKTKKGFSDSINMIISFFAHVFIFIVGYSPLLLLLLIVIFLIWRLVRKRKNDRMIQKRKLAESLSKAPDDKERKREANRDEDKKEDE